MIKNKLVSLKNLFLGLCIFLLPLGTSCKTKEKVIFYTVCEQERLEYLQADLKEKFTDYDIIFQKYTTGELFTKLKNEGEKSDCDIFHDVETVNASLLKEQGIFAELSEYDFSIYDESANMQGHKYFATELKTNTAILINKKILKEKGITQPSTYNDLLDDKYKNLISMPNPKSSGTGYCFYNGFVSNLGKKEALKYMEGLSKNVKEFTSSGSTPIQEAKRGDVAVAFSMLWQAVAAANANEDLEVVFLDDISAYTLYSFGMIKGHEKKKPVKEVFDYLYNDLNKRHVEKFCPDRIYKEEDMTKIPNYPTTFNDISMEGLFDSSYKQDLLDSWKW